MLEQIKKEGLFPFILATTMKENGKSVQLLEKLGLQFEKEIEADGETLLLYRLPTEQVKGGN